VDFDFCRFLVHSQPVKQLLPIDAVARICFFFYFYVALQRSNVSERTAAEVLVELLVAL
jgi:hypothetical protein